MTKILYVGMDSVLIDTSVAKDKRTKIGLFIGEHINFDSATFPNWRSVLNYLLNS